MDIETVFTGNATATPRVRMARSAASFVIIAQKRKKKIWVLVVDDPTKYGTNVLGYRVPRIGFSGGKAKLSETPQETAEREVREEIGLHITLNSPTSELLLNLTIIDANHWRKPHSFTAFSTFDFSGKIKPSGDIARAFWVPVTDLINRQNLLENHRAALEIFARKYT